VDGEDQIEYDDHGLPQPAGGRKEYQDEHGVVPKVVEWFGYKSHLLVDVRHEVVVAHRVTSPKTGDKETIADLVAQAQANLPTERIETLAYAKAADDDKVHEALRDAGIKPVIQNRALCTGEPERLLPTHEGTSNVVHDETGTVYCYDQVREPPGRHRMAYIGHEPDRGTIKYRCPARHEGWACPRAGVCDAGKRYGKTVRVKHEIGLRRFPPSRAARSCSSGCPRGERRWRGSTAASRARR
jgi:hypothetical protein